MAAGTLREKRENLTCRKIEIAPDCALSCTPADLNPAGLMRVLFTGIPALLRHWRSDGAIRPRTHRRLHAARATHRVEVPVVGAVQRAAKWGLKINPRMLPVGVRRVAVMIPSPTSDTGVCSVAPAATASCTAA